MLGVHHTLVKIGHDIALKAVQQNGCTEILQCLMWTLPGGVLRERGEMGGGKGGREGGREGGM